MMLNFPAGRTGAALLLLRLYVAANACGWVTRCGAAHLWLCDAIGVLGVCIFLGLFTRTSAILLSVVTVICVFQGILIPQTLLQLLNIASLALAGAGALSVDARIFGRQVVKILP